MKYLSILFISTLISLNAFSSDPLNTYRFNRKNVVLRNNKIDQNNWFEWWYYKIVLPKTGESFFFVYGVVNPWDLDGKKKASRGYMGMGDFFKKFQLETIYPVNKFKASYEETFVSLPDGTATDKHIEGKLIDDNGNIAEWNIKVAHKWTFNATGWATGKMLTNIEWYPAQADAICSGTIVSLKRVIKFKDAPCYQDRNWGNSFSNWWTWIVSNHFKDHPNTTLSVGGGNPILLNRFNLKGVAIGLKHKGKEYTFRPNDLDKVKININYGNWQATGINQGYKIEIKATAPKESFMDLQFMTPKGSIFHDYETLTGKVEVKLFERQFVFYKKWKLIDTLVSNYAGIEYGSNDEHKSLDFFNQKLNLFSNF